MHWVLTDMQYMQMVTPRIVHMFMAKAATLYGRQGWCVEWNRWWETFLQTMWWDEIRQCSVCCWGKTPPPTLFHVKCLQSAEREENFSPLCSLKKRTTYMHSVWGESQIIKTINLFSVYLVIWSWKYFPIFQLERSFYLLKCHWTSMCNPETLTCFKEPAVFSSLCPITDVAQLYSLFANLAGSLCFP